MAMRGLTQFIGDIRSCTNKEEEVCCNVQRKRETTIKCCLMAMFQCVSLNLLKFELTSDVVTPNDSEYVLMYLIVCAA